MTEKASNQLPTQDFPQVSYPFFTQLARTINSRQAQAIVISGNIYDLFFDGKEYVPIIEFLQNKTKIPGLIQVTYELNQPIRVSDEDRAKLREAWTAWKNKVTVEAIDRKSTRLNSSHSSVSRMPSSA